MSQIMDQIRADYRKGVYSYLSYMDCMKSKIPMTTPCDPTSIPSFAGFAMESVFAFLRDGCIDVYWDISNDRLVGVREGASNVPRTR